MADEICQKNLVVLKGLKVLLKFVRVGHKVKFVGEGIVIFLDAVGN